jgi:ABC-type multidrug transport system fused ATPase/permease subunit
VNKGYELRNNPFITALKYTNFMPFKDRVKFMVLSFFNLILALIDILAVVILGIATIKSLGLPEAGQSNSINALIGILEVFGVESLTQFFSLVAALFVFRNLLSLMVSKILLNIVAAHQVVAGKGLFKSYLMGQHKIIDQLKEQEKLNLLTDSMNAATLGMIANFTLATSELILLSILALFITVYNFTIGLVSVFFLSVVFFLIQRKLGNATQKTLGSYTLRNMQARNLVSEVSNNVLEIRLSGASNHFTKEFEHIKKSTISLYAKSVFFSQLPKFVLELSVILGGCFLAIWAFTFSDEGAAIELLVVYVGLSLRILPSLLRLQGYLFNTYSASGYAKLYLDTIFQMEPKDLRLLFDGRGIQISESPRNSEKPLRTLDIDSLVFSYPARDWILKIPTLTVESKGVIRILGTSGSGKTTLIKLLIGELSPSEGFISVNGIPIKKWISENPKSIAYVSQNNFLMTGSVLENVALGVPPHDVDKELLFESLRLASLDTFVQNLPNGVFTKIKELQEELSGGQVQRIALARALYTQPKILILDEPTSALDIATREEIEKVIQAKKSDLGIVLISHEESEYIDFNKMYRMQTNRGVSTLIEIV